MNWKLGIGSHMLAYLIAWARQTGTIGKINLCVRVDNLPAIHLYEKYGFVREGCHTREFYLHGQFIDAYIMRAATNLFVCGGLAAWLPAILDETKFPMVYLLTSRLDGRAVLATFGVLPAEQVRASMKCFTHEVMPNFPGRATAKVVPTPAS